MNQQDQMDTEKNILTNLLTNQYIDQQNQVTNEIETSEKWNLQIYWYKKTI